MLVMMAAQELANGISYSGHMYAMTRAGRLLTPAGDLQETFGGMEQVRVEKSPGPSHCVRMARTVGVLLRRRRAELQPTICRVRNGKLLL